MAKKPTKGRVGRPPKDAKAKPLAFPDFQFYDTARLNQLKDKEEFLVVKKKEHSYLIKECKAREKRVSSYRYIDVYYLDGKLPARVWLAHLTVLRTSTTR